LHCGSASSTAAHPRLAHQQDPPGGHPIPEQQHNAGPLERPLARPSSLGPSHVAAVASLFAGNRRSQNMPQAGSFSCRQAEHSRQAPLSPAACAAAAPSQACRCCRPPPPLPLLPPWRRAAALPPLQQSPGRHSAPACTPASSCPQKSACMQTQVLGGLGWAGGPVAAGAASAHNCSPASCSCSAGGELQFTRR
jgi:hypothetical protein